MNRSTCEPRLSRPTKDLKHYSEREHEEAASARLICASAGVLPEQFSFDPLLLPFNRGGRDG